MFQTWWFLHLYGIQRRMTQDDHIDCPECNETNVNASESQTSYVNHTILSLEDSWY